jgi:hypothetical protein
LPVKVFDGKSNWSKCYDIEELLRIFSKISRITKVNTSELLSNKVVKPVLCGSHCVRMVVGLITTYAISAYHN